MVHSFTEGESFEQLVYNNPLPVIVHFYANWCGPCKKLGPILESDAAKQNFCLVKVNVDDHPDLADKFQVKGIPYVVLFKGQEMLHDFAGNNNDELQIMYSKLIW